MQTINYQDIDLSSMELSKIQGTKSSVYIDNDKCYKILDKLYMSEKMNLLKKFNGMDGITIDGVILPKELIMDRNMLVGYTMDYFKDSMDLYDFFTQGRFVDVNDIFLAVKKASLIARKAHEKGIVLQDFSFDNILSNKDSDIRICDIDGCKFNGEKSPFISRIMHNYFNVLLRRRFTIDENFDNQSLLLSMIVSIYHGMVINMDTYDTLSGEIKTLKDIRSIFSSLLRDPDTKVPYLDEIICDNDHFVIDRDKQVSPQKRLTDGYKLF
jgi:hypothetical protein